MLTKEKYEKMVSLYSDFEEKAIQVAREKYEIEYKSVLRFDEYKIEFDFESIEIHFTQYARCSCCGDDYVDVSFPTDFLFDDSWKEVFRKRIQSIEEEKERTKEAERIRFQQMQEARERAELQRLKEKFKEE